MTKENQENLHRFETRVRQLILKYKSLQEETQELYAMVDEQDNTIRRLKEENAQLQKKYDDLKTAKMLEITSDESEGAQKRIARLIREIDKCISLINI